MSAKFDLEFLTDLQTNMREISETAFQAQQAETNYELIANKLTDEAKSVQLFLPINADNIDTGVDAAEIHFSTMNDLELTYDIARNSKGLEIGREDFTDGPRGAKRAADWARNMGASAGYLPQKQCWKVVTDGETVTTQVDDLALFHNAHRNHPLDASKGTYANLFTGLASSGSANNPGALPITGPIDTAFANVGKALAGVRMVKQSDGVTPRSLRAKYMFVSPTEEARALQLTGANFLGASGSSDVSSVAPVRRLQVVVVDELPSDGSWYLGVEEIAGSEIGAVTYWEREAFSIKYLDGMTDAQLDAADVLRWHGRGRSKAFAGIPFKLFKIKAT